MKAKISTLLMALTVLCYFSSSGQGRQFITTFDAKTVGTPFPTLVDTPIGYNTSGKTYPLLVFLHGTGESSGTAANDAGFLAGNYLNKIYNSAGAGGPSYFIANGTWPDSFANPVTGVYEQFIVVTPQAPGWSTSSDQLKNIINHIIAAGYRVDLNRIYITGLSAGGQGVVEYAASISTTPTYKPAALVPMSMAQGEVQSGAASIVKDSIRVWGFGQTTTNADSHGVATENEIGFMNAIIPGYARFTNYIGTSPHCCWNTLYVPSYKEVINGKSMNIYEWMLMANRSSLGTTPTTVNAGAPQTITLPTNQVTLTGTATPSTGHTISTYLWTKLTGGAATITLSGNASTTVTGLTQGVYTFQILAIDNISVSAKSTVQVTVNAAPVSVPTANAGTAQSVQLPTSQVTLNGTASTVTNGTISTYAWSQQSGPNTTAVITTPGAATTTVTGLAAGVYVFKLIITDNNGNTSFATIQVTVTAAAAPVSVPTANAGTAQSVQLPTSQVSLNGTASTVTNGTISTYAWSQQSGPNTTAVITTPGAATTTVTGLAAGVYVFKLTITDNNGNTSSATVQITMTAAAPPSAPSPCGGTRKILAITADDQGIYMTGAASNVHPGDTLIVNSKYRWAYLSGDGFHGTSSCPIVIMNDTGQVEMTNGIAFSNSTYLHVTGTGGPNHFYGFYIHSYASVAPASRGNSIQISDRSAHVEIDHIDEYVKTYAMWLKEEAQCADSLRYPNWTLDDMSIHDIRAKNINQDGFYIGSTSPNGERSITCNGNTISPIPMRVSNIHIYNIILDSVGRTGIQISGGDKGNNEINNCHVTRTGFEFNPTQGSGIILGGYTQAYVHDNYIRNTYQHGISCLGAGLMRIEGNDIDSSGYLQGVANPDYSSIAADTRVTTNQGTTAPINSTIYVKNNKVGVTSNRTGTVSAYRSIDIGYGYANLPTWNNNNIICGNIIQNATPAEFRINPNIGYTSNCATLPNKPPVANAGADKTITLPVNTVTQAGSGTDPDGVVSTYAWSWISGPSQYTIVSPAQAQTIINNLVQGTYQFQLAVTDNSGAVARDTVVITVLPAANIPPVANAGANQTITLPVNSVTQTGSGTDQDGTVTAYAWTWISGPSQYTIVSPAQAQTVFNNLVAGTYQFQLTVTDNKGATDKDTVSILVLATAPPANTLPVAVAGADQTITLPVNSVTQAGSGTDADGTISSYQWTWVSGPSQYTIVSPRQAQTVFSNLAEGVYQFKLTVTDNSGGTATSTVTITVLAAPPPANIPPVSNPGPDRTVVVGETVIVDGSASYDPDGTIVKYAWIQLSGPGGLTMTNVNTNQTTLYNLRPGVYVFQLTVTDNNGATNVNTVTITVTAITASQDPVAVAGSDTTLTFPDASSVTLNGSASYDPGGTITTYSWKQLSGPAASSMDNSAASITQVAQLIIGTYQFELTVTDDKGLSSSDTVTIHVQSNLRHDGYIKLFPNPVINQQVTVQGMNDYMGEGRFTVYDITGRLLKEVVVNKQSSEFLQTIYLTGVQRGVYVLRVQFAGQSKPDVFKLVVD